MNVSYRSQLDVFPAWFGVSVYHSGTCLSLSFRDVTERVERDRELERFETMVETVQGGLYLAEEEGVFQLVNEAYVEMVGMFADGLVGSPVGDVGDKALSE